MTTESLKEAPPLLFNKPGSVNLRQGEQWKPVYVEITPDGCYAGNGQFQTPEGTIFKVIGFDRSNGREFWIGRGFVITQHT